MTQQNHSWKKHLGSWGTYAAALYSGVQDVTASLVNQGNVLTSQDATFAVDQVNEKMLVKNFEPTHRFGFAAFSTNGAHHLTVAMTAANFIAKAYALSQPILVAGQKSSFPALRVHNQVSSRGPVGTATEIIGFKSTNTGDLGWMRIKVFDHNGDGFPDGSRRSIGLITALRAARLTRAKLLPLPLPSPALWPSTSWP